MALLWTQCKYSCLTYSTILLRGTTANAIGYSTNIKTRGCKNSGKLPSVQHVLKFCPLLQQYICLSICLSIYRVTGQPYLTTSGIITLVWERPVWVAVIATLISYVDRNRLEFHFGRSNINGVPQTVQCDFGEKLHWTVCDILCARCCCFSHCHLVIIPSVASRFVLEAIFLLACCTAHICFK